MASLKDIEAQRAASRAIWDAISASQKVATHKAPRSGKSRKVATE